MPDPHAPSSAEAWQLLQERMRRDLVIPYVGAGISAGYAPTWKALLNALEGKRPDEADPNAPPETVRADILSLELGEALVKRVMAHLEESTKPFDAARSDHAHFLRGDWPALLTTNWDAFLEAAWRWHASTSSGRREPSKAPDLPVRFRKDASRFLAELQAGAWPGPLMKLHGDLEQGQSEFIFTHTQYRRLIKRGVELQAVFQHLLTQYSLLFYGTSLTDPDLLGFMDDAQERLGHVAGPHFWLTADRVSPERRRFLFQRYAIHVMDSLPASAQKPTWKTLLDELVRQRLQARERGAGVVDATERFTVKRGASSVTLDTRPLTVEHVREAMEGDEVAFAASVWPRAGQLPPPDSGALWRLACQALGDAGRSFAKLAIEEGRAYRLCGGVWVVAGQREGGFAAPWLIRRACEDLVRQAQAAGYTRIRMGLPGTGSRGLPRSVVLGIVLHAVGVASDPQRALDVEIYSPPVPKDPFMPNLVADAAAGRVDVVGPLSRGRRGSGAGAGEARGLRLVHVVHPTLDIEGRRSEVLSSVLLDRDTTLEQLISRLPGLPSPVKLDEVRLSLPESLHNAGHPEAKDTRDLSLVTDQLIVTLRLGGGAASA